MKYPGGSAGQVGEQVSYAYTTQGLLDTVIGAATYVGDTTWNVRGQVTERRLGSASGVVKQQYAYTAAENFRLVSLKAGTGPTYDNRQKINYTYDDDGNIQTMADAAAYGGSQTQSFAYDTLDRLSTAQASGSTTYGGYAQRGYAYSSAGNIANFEGAALTYQDAAHKHAVTHIGSVQKYWYDANGNARRINGSQDATLTYDAENRLTAMSGSVTANYVYDAEGSRVQETIAGVTRVFISNYYEVDNGTVKKYYYAGAARVAENSGGILYYLLGDHLGSTALTLDSSGNRTTELRYYPYGAARYNPGSQVTTYRFTGQRWDSGMALYFYQSRWYDPVIGRFLAADTLVPRPEDPQNLNRYSYCGSNPLRFVDPSGHAGVDFWGGGGGAGIGLAVALMQGAQQTMTQVQGAIYQYGPVAAQNTWLYGNQTIAVGDQISQAVQNAGQGGNTTGPGGLDPNDPRFKKATEQAAQTQRNAVTSSGLNAFSRAADFGIRSYNQLRGVTSGTGLQAHHLIEERFAKGLGLDAGKIPSIALTPQEHQVFTNAWRNAIGYLGSQSLEYRQCVVGGYLGRSAKSLCGLS